MNKPTEETTAAPCAGTSTDDEGVQPDYRTGPYAEYKLHLSRALIDQIYHYSHYIPNFRGFTEEFFDRRYPGWDLERILRVFKAAGIEVNNKPCGMMGKCHWKVKVLHFNGASDFTVEWNEGIEEDDGRYFWYGEHVPERLKGQEGPQTHTGYFSIATAGLDIGNPEVRRAVADYALEKLGAAPDPEAK